VVARPVPAGFGRVEQSVDLGRGQEIFGALVRVGGRCGASGGTKASATLYISPLGRLRRHCVFS
jgi:hypothetical protein